MFTFAAGWADETVNFIKMMFTKISGGNEELYNLFTRYRYRAAATIARTTGNMLRLMNMSNGLPIPEMDEDPDEEMETLSQECGEVPVSEEEEEERTVSNGDENLQKEREDDSSDEQNNGLFTPGDDEQSSSSEYFEDCAEESEDDSPDERRKELTPPSDDEKPSSSQEADQEESEGDSPEEQRVG